MRPYSDQRKNHPQRLRRRQKISRKPLPSIKLVKNQGTLILFLISLLISLLILEVGLRTFTVFPIHGKKNQKPHPMLGYTFDPSLSDVDINGFRNKDANGPHEIVALGDSHTQGVNVIWNDSWPYQLGKLLNKSVYNYAIGGYGIFHYPFLADAAFSHHQKYVILGLFAENDINGEACATVTPSYYQELLRQGLAIGDCSVRLKRRVRAKHWLKEKSAILSLISFFRFGYITPDVEFLSNK